VRDYLHLKPGDRLKFFFQQNGAEVILPLVVISKIKGSVPRLNQPVSIEQRNAAIEADATREIPRLIDSTPPDLLAERT